MTHDQKQQARKELHLELKARREVLRRLSYPLKQLQAAADKEEKRRRKRTEALLEYKTESEIMDAYGYEMITDDERRALLEALESGERYVADTLTPVGLALRIMRKFSNSLETEASAIAFELLPRREQLQRIEADEKRRDEIKARRSARRPGAGPTDPNDYESLVGGT